MTIQPLPPITTRVDACADQLRAAIMGGSFTAGARLPAERELAASFGVTRPTLRGALARLTAQGLVVAHQGRGTTVCDFEQTGGPELIGDLLAQGASKAAFTRDLLAVRRALASVVLERIAELRPDPGPINTEVARFSQLVALGADDSELAEADVRILQALLSATASPVFRLCLNPILRVLSGSAALRSALYRSPQDNAIGWQLMLGWLVDPKVEQIPMLVAALAERDEATLVWLDQ
jgi:DNA-binding FadR family transcriptional regulator